MADEERTEVNTLDLEGAAGTPPDDQSADDGIGDYGDSANSTDKRDAKDTAAVETPPGTEDATDEQDPSTDGDAEEGAESDAEAQPPAERKGGVQKRIDKLTAEKYEERQARELAEQQAAELQQRLEALEASRNVGVPEKPVGEPREEDYEDYSDYSKALVQYEIQQGIQANRQAEVEFQRQQILSQKLAVGVATYPDFDQVVRDPKNGFLTAKLVDVANNVPGTADVLYHLAKNPAEGMRIANLSPLQMAAEIGRIEGQLSQQRATPPAPKRQKATISNAPSPIEPIGSGKAGVKSIFDPNITHAEYRKLRGLD